MILVVDDNPRIVEVVGELLRNEGYTVETARDGVEAFQLVRKPECKCMLLDVNMPRINGVELLLLMQSEGIKVPTIIVAAFDDFDEKEMKQFPNVVRFLHKPFDTQEMLRAVRAHALKKK